MGSYSFWRGASFSAAVLGFAAGIAPLAFLALILMMAFGFVAFAFGPIILAFVGWMMLKRMERRALRESRESEIIEARVIREEKLPFPPEAYTPPVHFDLLLSAKQDVGRIRGAAGGIDDAATIAQFRALAERADVILALIVKEPAKLGLARRFFSSYLPRAADLAEGYHGLARGKVMDQDRKAKLLDVLVRLEHAMRQQEKDISSAELMRIDADLKILNEDLKGFSNVPNFTRTAEPILNRIDEIVKKAKKRE